jgi:hypothetical protein
MKKNAVTKIVVAVKIKLPKRKKAAVMMKVIKMSVNLIAAIKKMQKI